MIRARLKQFIALILAYVFLALALLGTVLPGLPTVPFLLLTAWCAARGSERLQRWLYQHPQLGQMLRDWEQQGAITRTSKGLALVMLCISGVILYYQISNPWALAAILSLLVCVAAYLLSRPVPTATRSR